MSKPDAETLARIEEIARKNYDYHRPFDSIVWTATAVLQEERARHAAEVERLRKIEKAQDELISALYAQVDLYKANLNDAGIRPLLEGEFAAHDRTTAAATEVRAALREGGEG